MRRAIPLLIAALLIFLPLSAGAQEESLVLNGGFELVDASGKYPVGWEQSAYKPQSGFTEFSITEEKAHSGQRSAKINSINLNDARYITTVEVEPESMYRLSGYILVEWMGESGNGANFGLEDIYGNSECLQDTGGEWQYVEWYGETGENQTELTFGVRVGGFSSESEGCAYFDDISLVKVDSLPKGTIASLWYSYRQEGGGAAATEDVQSRNKSTALFIVLSVVFLMLGAVFCLELRSPRDLRNGADDAQMKRARIAFGACLIVSLAVRIWLAACVEGYDVDVNCFTLWSKRMAQLGPRGFYAEGYFCDYPPAYLYILYLNGLLMRIMPESWSLVIIKLFPIICDMAISVILYRAAEKRVGAVPAALIALLYAINPASFITGAAWGQVDAALALIILLTAIFAVRKRWIIAIPLFFVAALMKPQALLLAPVGGLYMIFTIARLGKGKRKGELLEALYGFLIAVAVSAVIILPFSVGQKDMGWLISRYRDTLASYDYATVNTANLYYLLGGNWSPLTEAVSETAEPVLMGRLLPLITGAVLLLGGGAAMWLTSRAGGIKPRNRQELRKALLSAAAILFALIFIAFGIFSEAMTFLTYGYIMFALVFVWALCFFLPESKPEALPFALALTLTGVYVLTLKMHERYLYAGLVLLLLGYILTRDRRLIHLLIGFSATTFLNTAIVLDNSILFGASYGHLRFDTEGLNITLCAINLALLLYAAYISFTGLRESKTYQRKAVVGAKKDECYRDMVLKPRSARLGLTWRDYAIMGATMLIYGALCFSTLGSTKAPQTAWEASSSQERIVFEVDTDEPYELLYYGGVNYDDFTIAESEDGVNWSEDIPCEMREGVCYRWLYVIDARTVTGEVNYDLRAPETTHYFTGRYLRLTSEATGLKLYELVARDESHNALPMSVISQTGTKDNYIKPQSPALLIDERDTLTGEPGWYNGTYFDEIYHVRTAIEHIQGKTPYEYTHPPLGKLLIALGILIFGQTPFGWRFMGAFTGVIMLPVMYLLAKRLTKRRDLSIFAMLVMALDLMHFAQTRLATIDSYPVLFIMLSVLCMAGFIQSDFFAKGRAFYKSWIPLGLSGVFMGLAIASKWIGVYAAAGLAVLFFSQIYRVCRAGSVAIGMEEDAGGRVAVAKNEVVKRVLLTCLACIGFFILVPALIYYLSYIPHLTATGRATISRLIDVQESMFVYHSKPGLGMDHPFQSPWYEWPLILKPMWYVKDYYEPAGYNSTIFCMGNPFIFYTGALAMLGAFGLMIKKYLTVRSGVLRPRQGNGDMTLYIIVISFLAQYLPWVLVPRSMYMYHYFASVPFIMLAVTYWLSLIKRKKLSMWLIIGYIAVSAAMFVFFYPYASGMVTSNAWLDAVKRLFAGLYY